MKLGATALRSNFTELAKPYKLTFSMTYWCQSRCLTCSIWEIRPKNELTLQEIQEFAKKNNSFQWIELTGGEPFMRSDVVEIAKAFYENCKDLYIITMPTNSLCNPDLVTRKIEEMLNLGIPRLSITLSLDGYRELHDKIRGVKGNFDRVMEMGKRLHELQKRHKNLFFIFGYTMSSYNQGMLEQTYQEVKKELPFITHNNFHMNVGQISEIYYHNIGANVSPEKNALAKEIREFVSKRSFEVGTIPIMEGAFLRKLVNYAETGETPVKSKSLDASLFLDSYGNVFPSIMWSRKIGNIRDTNYDLTPIWHSAEADEVRKLVKEGKEPKAWTACEAYQALAGNIKNLLI